jgi:mannose-6-phosphate isomerase-like protein (cupin superfamily)
MNPTKIGKIDFNVDKRPWGSKMDAILPQNTNTRIEILLAETPLSIHVHPITMDEIYIFKENGSLYLDLKHDVSFHDFKKNIYLQNDIPNYLNKIDASANEMFFIPGGVVHSLIKGTVFEIIKRHVNCKMCETCHSCNTFRIFDWNRNNRPLQQKLALDTMEKFISLRE